MAVSKKIFAVVGGVSVVLLVAAAVALSVNTGAPAALLQTKLAAGTVLTTSGQALPISSLYQDSEPVSEFPSPHAEAMQLKSPKTWLVTMDTNVGPFKMKVHRDWAPKGADRFYSLVMNKFYDGARFFRYADNFVVQWGLRGDPQIDEMYQNGANIMDDPRNIGNSKGTVTFATSGQNTRSTQVFVNLADNHFLDTQGFTPFGEIVDDGLQLFERKINAEYGEKADQNQIISQGNQLYLKKAFPHMSYIASETVQVLEE